MNQNVYQYDFEEKRRRNKRISTFFLITFIVILMLSLITKFFIFPVLVKSNSMSPAFSKNCGVAVSPLGNKFARGTVVYVDPLDGKKGFCGKLISDVSKFLVLPEFLGFNRNSTESACLRRICAVPGDTVYMENFVLYIKSKGQDHFLTEYELSDTEYSTNIGAVPELWNQAAIIGNFSELTLGENQYFLLADSRVNYSDSRLWGPVGAEKIKGQVILEYLPPDHFNVF